MRGLAPYWIDPRSDNVEFPDVSLALDEPDGLLAIGGDLKPQRLLAAYRLGIFPWYNEGQPILWWAPNPRAVLFPQQLKISRSLGKTLRKKPFTVTLNHAFADVIDACSHLRSYEKQPGTWITHEMKQAYQQLHEQGYAHSVECWHNGQLAGGLYGIAIGRVFFGESMFTRHSNASKVAFITLTQQLMQWGFGVIDCQVHSQHLESLGAETIRRGQFTDLLNTFCEQSGPVWQFEPTNNT